MAAIRRSTESEVNTEESCKTAHSCTIDTRPQSASSVQQEATSVKIKHIFARLAITRNQSWNGPNPCLET
eukprot:23406-Eustigmatos_ZCMA.PRE.1